MSKISILMPVYNDSEYLKQAIDSVIKQTIDDKELICVDDGSSDNSLEILKEYAKRYDFIKVFTKENEGSGIARNYALNKSSGDYIAYLDSDDIFIDKNALNRMYSVAFKNNADMVSANLKGSELNGDLVDNFNLERFITEKSISPQDYGIPYSFYKNIFRKDFLVKNNIQFPNLLRGQDPVFLAEILTLVDEIYTIPLDLYGFRYPDGGSLLKINTYQKKHDYIRHFKDTFDILDNASFKVMKQDYEDKLIEYINFNKCSFELKSIVYDIFGDEDLLKLFIKPKISIFITKKSNNQAVKSIYNQSFDEFEIIYDFQNIRGEYVLFLNEDDDIRDFALEKLFEVASHEKSDIILFKTVDNYLNSVLYHDKLALIYALSCLFKKDIILNKSLNFNNYSFVDEFLFFNRKDFSIDFIESVFSDIDLNFKNKYLLTHINSPQDFKNAKKICFSEDSVYFKKTYDLLKALSSYEEFKADYEFLNKTYEIENLKSKITKLEKENIDLKKQKDDLANIKDSIINSKSFRVTKVFRKIKHLFK